MASPTSNTIVPEEIRVRGSQLVEKVHELIAAGNVRKITVKHDEHTIVDVPLTIGVIGTLLAPQVAALGAIAALITECTIEITRDEPPAGVCS
jgi:hypothetical protein